MGIVNVGEGYMKNPGVMLEMVLVMALVCVSAAYAEPYKWTDKDGVVHYSDQKPDESAVHPESTVENPDLDSGNFVSAEDAGLLVTEEEKKRWAEEDARKKEEERLERERINALPAESQADEGEDEDEKDKDDDNHHDDGYYYVPSRQPIKRPIDKPVDRPIERPIQRPVQRPSR